jgi:signal transduction histidine kinase
MRWSIRAQLLLPVLLLLAGVAAISAATAYASTWAARHQLERRLRDLARSLDEGRADKDEEVLRFPLGPVLPTLRALTGAHFLLYHQSGKVDTTFPVLPRPAPPEVPVADSSSTLSLAGPVRVAGTPYLCGGMRLSRPDYAGADLYIFYPESLWNEARWAAMLPSIVLGVTVGLAAVVLALVQAGGLGRRVQELEEKASRIASGDFSPMPLPQTNDEMRDLAVSVNEMASQLANLQDAIRRTERLRLLGQVSGGLAHELRNGLTGARLAVQLYLHEKGEVEEGGPLSVALRQLTLLETQVQRLLGLGKAGPPVRQRHDLAEALREATALLRPRCRHAGITLEAVLPDGPVEADIDAGQWAQMLVNLLGNAIDAAGPEGRVEARLSVQDGKAVVEVLDSGPGPGEEVAARLFDPFVTSKPEGIGLGLAVARTVAEAHGGSISWSRKDGQTCFRVEVPLGGA